MDNRSFDVSYYAQKYDMPEEIIQEIAGRVGASEKKLLEYFEVVAGYYIDILLKDLP